MNKFSRAYVVVTVIQSAATGWFFSTYVLFILGNGLTLFHANMLNVGYMTVNFLLNPSTGHLADRIGRRQVYVLGQIFWAGGMLVYWLGHSFWVFLLAEMTGAVGMALMSGALDSWLRSNVGEEITHRALARSAALGPLAQIPTALLGGAVGELFGLQWPWFLAGASSLVSAIVALWLLLNLPEGGHEVEVEVPPLRQIVVETLWSKPLRFSMLVALVSWGAFAPVNMFWAPIMKERSGGATWWLGSLWIGVALATAVGAHLTGEYGTRSGKWEIARAIVLAGAPLLLAPVVPGLVVLLMAFLVHQVGRVAVEPLLFTYANRHIDDAVRSTVNSVRSSSRTLGAVIGLAISGVLTLVMAPVAIWGLSAIALISLSLYVAWRKE